LHKERNAKKKELEELRKLEEESKKQEEEEKNRTEKQKQQIKAEEEAAAAAEAASVSASVDDGAKFEMTSLAEALTNGNQDDINKAIVVEFLEGHDPSKVPDVDQMLKENKGNEAELMKELAERYDDPVETEVKIVTETLEPSVEVINTTAAGTTQAAEEEEQEEEEEQNEDFIEATKKEAEKLKEEEEIRIAAMNEEEKKAYFQELSEQAQHNDLKDQMLKQQLNIYSSNGAKPLNLVGGRGRGKKGASKGKAAKMLGVESEYIVNGKNEGGEWEVNQKM